MFAAFDRFPGTKGSAVHIARSAGDLFDWAGSGLLAVLGGGGLPAVQHEGAITIARCDIEVPNLLQRADTFAGFVDELVGRHAATLRLVQARDPWSVAPALAHPDRRYQVVYELNGFPSIELPVAWPHVAPATLAKIAAVEEACLRHADAVVTPSATIAALAITRGADPDRTHVVPNGADVPPTRPPRPAGAPDRYVAYVGALQTWQGFGTLLRAMARLVDLPVDLVVCSSWSTRRARPWVRMADRLGLGARVHWQYELPHAKVAAWLTHAEVSAAPLADTERNTVQGCCPLKVLESMAVGTPVVASDLACVREIMGPDQGLLVEPDRPAALARALRALLDDPARRRQQGEAARRRITAEFTWQHNRARLRRVWDGLASPQHDGAR